MKNNIDIEKLISLLEYKDNIFIDLMYEYNENIENVIQQKNTELNQNKSIIQQKDVELQKIQNSKSFQIGDLFFRSIQKPCKLLTYPYNFIKILISK